MARRSRKDEPGRWHHVMNRAIARRTLFEDRTDVRYFLSRLAREVRAGRLEMHAWSVMTTHFHLLVRSPRGELSEAMRRAQNEYVRHFNRRHRRDGTLMRGRFFSKPVTTERYRRVLVAYIDQNPVVAGIVSRTWLYPWGSATHFASERSVPWHERAWVHSVVEEVREEDEALGTTYRRRFGGSLQPGLTDWIEQRLSFRGASVQALDDLVNTAPEGVLDWMRRKARLADGHLVGEPVGSLKLVDDLARESHLEPTRLGDQGRPIKVAWVFRVAMCRLLASASWNEIGNQTGRPASSCASSFKRHHARLIDGHEPYRQAAARVGALVAQAVSGQE